MDVRDWIAGASLLISLGALGVASYALRLTWMRDRREIEAKSPAIDITLPPCLGPGPWEATCEITNRSVDTVVLEAIMAKMVAALIIHVPHGRDASGHHREKGEDPFPIDGRRIDREIKPGETVTETFMLRLFGSQKQLPGPTTITFYVDLRAKNELQTRSRRTIARTARI